jgi:hypothetical protein
VTINFNALTENNTMNIPQKLIIKLLAFCVLLPLASCLESDELDGLTDTRPEIAVNFPGRTYDQNGGLVFINTGLANNPDVSVVMELEGGEGRTIASLKSVEVRAVQLTNPTRTCGYVVYAENVPANNQRQFIYSAPLAALAASKATCSEAMVRPDLYYEFIFTVVLDNGAELVTMPVRSIVKE